MEREEHLLVGRGEAVVLAAARGVDLDPVDADERFELSIGVSLDDRSRTTALSATFASSRSTTSGVTIEEDNLDPLGR